MPVGVPATIIAIFCLTCCINEALTLPAPVLPQVSPIPVAFPYSNPTPVSSNNVSPVREEPQNAEASDSQPSMVGDKLPSLRQETQTPVQGMISSLTSMVGGLVPYLHRPETAPAAKPVEKPPTTKEADEKVAHLDHEHFNEPAESVPDGVVSGGFYYEGQKANGEYFNEEMPAAEALEVHSHEDTSSPGKLYDDNSEHPYYVVDKPAEGPAPPPIIYFTSGLRSNEASISAWSEYYAKLRQYYDYYYPSYRRAKNQRETEPIEAGNQNLDVIEQYD